MPVDPSIGLPKQESSEERPVRKTVMGLRVGIEWNNSGLSSDKSAKSDGGPSFTMLGQRYLLRLFRGNQSR